MFPPGRSVRNGRRPRCSRATSARHHSWAGRARRIRCARHACAKRARRILSGRRSVETLVNEHVGEIKAHIVERDGKVLIEKSCPIHGRFVDTLAINPAFLRRLESLFPGRDFPAVTETLHNHGTSSIKYGRGAVLTIDLTNRCNMMCDPCFMDANQVGYVHELTMPEVEKLLDDAVSIKPRRQMSVQFSGGEPTISPLFLDAIRYARKVGYFSVQAATNGIRFAQDPDFATTSLRRRPAHRLSAVRRRHRGGERAPQGRQPVRREAARDRKPLRRRHRRLPGRHDRQDGQRRSGRTDREVRPAELRQGEFRVVPARLVHGPRRGDQRRGTAPEALHALASRRGFEAADGRHPSPCGTGSRSRRRA